MSIPTTELIALRNRAEGGAGMRPVRQVEVVSLLDEIDVLRDMVSRTMELGDEILAYIAGASK